MNASPTITDVSVAGDSICLSLQRSVMSIDGRHVQSLHSSGVRCGIGAHDWTRRGWVTQPVGRGNLAPTMMTHRKLRCT